jgi:hypothetical protein
MGIVYGTILLITTVLSITAELITVLFPQKMVDIIETGQEGENGEVYNSLFVKLLGAISVFYVITIGLLVFSPDPVFRVYGLLLVAMSAGMLLLRKQLVRSKYIVMTESAICLIVLLDVARTIIEKLFLT